MEQAKSMFIIMLRITLEVLSIILGSPQMNHRLPGLVRMYAG